MKNIYEFDITRYSYSQKCMTHFEAKWPNILYVLNKYSRVFSDKELWAIIRIERIRKLIKRDLSPLEIEEFGI